ncbi:MAG: glycosyltransferase family 39 protein, partial [Anaerolineae bacterium]|nr:glycosyltransferase family 39 protein [Anaerolineae bacterium]
RLGQPATVGGSPLLFGGALLAFSLGGVSNNAARLLPMLSGLALVGAPLLFRKRLGRIPTLIAVGWLAISPTAVTSSRIISGAGLSMLGALIAIYALDRASETGKTGMALLSGAAFGAALLADYGTLAICLAIGFGVLFAYLTDEEEMLTAESVKAWLGQIRWTVFLMGTVVTIALLGTVFFIVPNGLGAAADLFTRFLQGIVRRERDVTYLGLSLLFYEPGLILFGMIGAWQASQSGEPWQRFMAGWGIGGLIICLIYQGAIPAHMLWCVVPMAGLAGIGISRMIEMTRERSAVWEWAAAAIYIALWAMLGASVMRALKTPHTLTIPPDAPPDEIIMRIPLDVVMIVLWVIMLAILWMSITSLIEKRAAWYSFGLGTLIIGLSFAAGQSATLSFARTTSPFEPMNVSPGQNGINRIVETIKEVSNLSSGQPYTDEVVVEEEASGALAWALHPFSNVEYVPVVNPSVASPMVITTGEDDNPALGSEYVGQDFVITESWTPENLMFTEFLSWTIYRSVKAETRSERVILWVRNDIYELLSAAGSE